MTCKHDSFERCYQACEGCSRYVQHCGRCGKPADVLYEYGCYTVCAGCVAVSEGITAAEVKENYEEAE